jgi:hypothetical protein
MAQVKKVGVLLVSVAVISLGLTKHVLVNGITLEEEGSTCFWIASAVRNQYRRGILALYSKLFASFVIPCILRGSFPKPLLAAPAKAMLEFVM